MASINMKTKRQNRPIGRPRKEETGMVHHFIEDDLESLEAFDEYRDMQSNSDDHLLREIHQGRIY